MRYDTAVILKRFFLIEKTLVICQAGQLPGLKDFNLKTLLPQMLWEDAMTANALRERVFELRFPSRMLEEGDDAALIGLIEHAQQAPTPEAFLSVVARVFKPALKRAYEAYLNLADEIGDGPTYRFLKVAIEEKKRHIEQFETVSDMRGDGEERARCDRWVGHIEELLAEAGGIDLNTTPVDSGVSALKQGFRPSETAVRDDTFHNVRFYWPDIVDRAWPYGSGLQLQLRSAVSHLNEIWAVENAGHVLFSFAGELGWEFVFDAARWVYDESRHCRMGYERLAAWGFDRRELPLGTYIYDSCRDQDPIHRLGMLFHFESKNIGRKMDRKKSFEEMNDRMSQHDMDFDWADETIHTSYGKTWLSAVLKLRGQNPDDYTQVREACERIVTETVRTVRPEEITEIRRIAERMIAKAAAQG